MMSTKYFELLSIPSMNKQVVNQNVNLNEDRNSNIYEVAKVWIKESLSANVDITSSIEKMLKNLVLKGIYIPNPEEVKNYLYHYPDIADVVESACIETRNRFKPSTQLSLELYRDPEIDDEYLTLYIRQKEYDDNIMDIIEDIWLIYSDELVLRSGDFLVTTDFDYPR